MTDLKQAAQQALEALESGLAFDTHSVVLQNLRTALAMHQVSEFAQQQQQAEPVETYIHEYRNQPHPNDFGIPKGHWWKAKQYADALYTTPPQRQWVGLTDEDLEFWTGELGQGELGRGVIRAVADHLKERNT